MFIIFIALALENTLDNNTPKIPPILKDYKLLTLKTLKGREEISILLIK